MRAKISLLSNYTPGHTRAQFFAQTALSMFRRIGHEIANFPQRAHSFAPPVRVRPPTKARNRLQLDSAPRCVGPDPPVFTQPILKPAVSPHLVTTGNKMRGRRAAIRHGGAFTRCSITEGRARCDRDDYGYDYDEGPADRRNPQKFQTEVSYFCPLLPWTQVYIYRDSLSTI